MGSFSLGEYGCQPVAAAVGLPLMLVSVAPADATALENRSNRPAMRQLSDEELRQVHARGAGENIVRVLKSNEQRNETIEIKKLTSPDRDGIASLTRRIQQNLPSRFRRMVQFTQVELLERQLRTGFRLNGLLSVDTLRAIVKGVSQTVGALTKPDFRNVSSQSQGRLSRK